MTLRERALQTKRLPRQTTQSKKRSKVQRRRAGERERLDVAVAKHAEITRQRAQALILAGEVSVGGETHRKPGTLVAASAVIEIQAQPPFVSRGGVKLERALDVFDWSVRGARCLDVGASTGGFTDCLLQRGAASVVALDVGYGHLAWPLRQNPKVRVRERMNFRNADLAVLGAPFDFVCADVSFISLTKLTHKLAPALCKDGRIIVLIKPQFEAGRDAVEHGGVVRSPASQVAAIAGVVASFEAAGLSCERLTYSPIKGPAGNIEFLLGARAAASAQGSRKHGTLNAQEIEGVVRAAHEALDR
jgi:23S rRNA (cytidine1920-2'-O)/16S rRNA (cytidine1409-2'-O)-methyltransferase